jgi:AmiR/NasT family two-component response regulator
VAEDRIDPGNQTCEADLLEQRAPLAATLTDAGRTPAAPLRVPDGVTPLVASRRALVSELERLRDELAAAEEKIAGLEAALGSNRQIGTAIGILMNQRRVDSQTAFDLLRTTSQHAHRKLRDIAAEVVHTGSLGR